MWAAAIFTLSTFKAVTAPQLVTWLEPDKLAHAAAYFVLASLIMWGLQRNGCLRPGPAAVAIGGSVFFGIALEIIQFAFFPGRLFEFRDIVANIIGAIASLLVYYLIK